MKYMEIDGQIINCRQFVEYTAEELSSDLTNSGLVVSQIQAQNIIDAGLQAQSDEFTNTVFDDFFLYYININGYQTLNELMLMAIDGCPKCSAIIAWYAQLRDSIKTDPSVDHTTIDTWLAQQNEPDLSAFT